MLLKSLELQGFKTFPDKTTLRFERGITSVVGPNGSGKSNISDGHALGAGGAERAHPALLQNGDVIFGGTPQRKALGFAEVTLTIDNSDRSSPSRGTLWRSPVGTTARGRANISSTRTPCA